MFTFKRAQPLISVVLAAAPLLGGSPAIANGIVIDWSNVAPDPGNVPDSLRLWQYCPNGSGPCIWPAATVKVEFSLKTGPADSSALKSAEWSVRNEAGVEISSGDASWSTTPVTLTHAATIDGSPGGGAILVACQRTRRYDFSVAAKRWRKPATGGAWTESNATYTKELAITFECRKPPVEKDYGYGASGDRTWAISRPFPQVSFLHFNIANAADVDRVLALEAFTSSGWSIETVDGGDVITLPAWGSTSVWLRTVGVVGESPVPIESVVLSMLDLESGEQQFAFAEVVGVRPSRALCDEVAMGGPTGSTGHHITSLGGPSGVPCPAIPGNEGPCDAPHFGTGCADLPCGVSVCSFDPYCCLVVWDESCAEIAHEFCMFDTQCIGDLNGDDVVDVTDLFILLESLGKCPPDGECPADLNGDGIVDFEDQTILMSMFGPCE